MGVCKGKGGLSKGREECSCWKCACWAAPSFLSSASLLHQAAAHVTVSACTFHALCSACGLSRLHPPCAGEWCVAQNVYENPGALNRTQYEALAAGAAARNGPPCTRVDAVTCFRTRASLRKAWDARATRAAASAPTPAAVGSGAQQGMEPLETLAANAPQPSVQRGASAAATAVGGRRRLRSA